MCITTEPSKPTLESPAIQLADELNRATEFEGYFTAHGVRSLIRERWDIITKLAHTIHGQECKEQLAIECREMAELRRLKAKYEGTTS